MWTRDDDVRMCEQSNAQRHIRRVFSFNLSVTLLHLRKCIFRCRKKKKSCLCRWAVIGDYSSLLCQIYRAREHSLDWICGRCLAGCLLVVHLYSCRCLDDLLIKYHSPALRMRVDSAEMGVCSVPELIVCLPKDYVLALAEEGNVWYCSTTALTSSVIIVLFLQREHWRTAVLNVQLLCTVSSNVLSDIKVTSLKRKIASALWFSLRLAK